MDRESATVVGWYARAARRVRSQRGEQGFVLLAVIGIVFFFAIVGVAIMNLTMQSGRLVDRDYGLAAATANTLDADGALEAAVDWYRDKGPMWAVSQGFANDCSTDALQQMNTDLAADGYEYTCEHPPLSAGANPTPESRVLDIVAYPDGQPTLEIARGRVRYTDIANGIALDGYTVEVCDWQLGEAVSEELRGCD